MRDVIDQVIIPRVGSPDDTCLPGGTANGGPDLPSGADCGLVNGRDCAFPVGYKQNKMRITSSQDAFKLCLLS